MAAKARNLRPGRVVAPAVDAVHMYSAGEIFYSSHAGIGGGGGIYRKHASWLSSRAMACWLLMWRRASCCALTASDEGDWPEMMAIKSRPQAAALVIRALMGTEPGDDDMAVIISPNDR